MVHPRSRHLHERWFGRAIAVPLSAAMFLAIPSGPMLNCGTSNNGINAHFAALQLKPGPTSMTPFAKLEISGIVPG